MVLKPNEIIHVKLKNDSGEQVYLSRVEDVSGNEIMIAAPIEGGAIVPVHLGSKIEITVKKEDPVQQGRFQAVGILKQRNSRGRVPVFIVELTGGWKKIQERDFVRVEVLLNGAFAPILEGDKISAKSTDIYIKDLSGGGFLFAHDEEISVGTDMMFTIKLSKDTVISCQGRIMRVKQVDGTYEYGVSFVDLDESSRQKIIQFVYRRQLEIYKKLEKGQP